MAKKASKISEIKKGVAKAATPAKHNKAVAKQVVPKTPSFEVTGVSAIPNVKVFVSGKGAKSVANAFNKKNVKKNADTDLPVTGTSDISDIPVTNVTAEKIAVVKDNNAKSDKLNSELAARVKGEVIEKDTEAPKIIKPTAKPTSQLPGYVQMPAEKTEAEKHKDLLRSIGILPPEGGGSENMQFLANTVKSIVNREDRRHFQHALIDVVKISHPNCEVSFEKQAGQCKISFKEGSDFSSCLVPIERVILE